MRLSSAQIFNQSITSVLQKQTATSKILDQLSSGKKVNTAGDDPVASQGIDNLNQKNALVDQFMKNIDYATNRLAVAESKLGSAEDLTGSMREQVMRAINGTLSGTERQMIAEEMKGSLEELLSIANSKDESGNYMFSGFSTDKEPFAFDNSTPPKIVYSGDSGVKNSLVQTGVAMGTNIYGPIRFARHSISILRRVHCTHIFGLLLRDSSGPDGYLLLLSLSSLRLHQSLCFRKVFSRSV